MLGITAALDSASTSLHVQLLFLFLRICQYDIFLVWYDFNVFGCVHNPLQVFFKVTE